MLCDENESLRPYGFDLTNITEKLIMNFPELVLNRVFTGDEKESLLVDILFKDRVLHYESLLNQVSVDSLVNWCNGNQDRIMKVAAAISPYSSTDKEKDPFDHPKNVKMSEHINALLEIADNPIDIVEIIFKNTWPGGWSGSLADILEVRSRAFAELLDHPSHEVLELANIKLALIKKSISINREQEEKENSSREQRFE
ncbi:MAG: hypothetical protein D3917_07445 [Candidatus Electrothrix sp. AX5]|nr:hypothetical protein [Candidatus Electrothrix sp. AX5]